MDRWSFFTPMAEIVEIHSFADASKRACAAVVYLRIVRVGKTHVTLQVAKSRVAPINVLSIPRLELCAAQLLTWLVSHFVEVTKIQPTAIHLWSDSTDVLCSCNESPSVSLGRETFVANRCSEINTTLPEALWHHVKSADNLADVASRGIEPRLLSDHNLWWQGSSWLTECQTAWPVLQDEDLKAQLKTRLSARERVLSVVSQATTVPATDAKVAWDLVDKYLSASILLRITAYCFRFLYKLKMKLMKEKSALANRISVLNLPFLELNDIPSDHLLSPIEVENARLYWVYVYQQIHFGEEIKTLAAGDTLDKTNEHYNSFLRLKAVVRRGLLRVGGRLTHSLLEEHVIHPVILPKYTNSLTTRLIRKAHANTLHGGTQATLGLLRRQYWIIRGRSAVFAVIRNCVVCIRYSKTTLTQLMGHLPQARVTPELPFNRTGVNYAGPVSLRLTKIGGNITKKGYIVIFVCMVTRAVHIEVAADLTSEAFIAAFMRFTARQGHCGHLYSDQGTNFIGADQILRQMFDEASNPVKDIAFSLARDGTRWHFNPPGTPHFGGLWDAAVKSVKHHLRRVMGEQVLTIVELSTLLCRIEACLNSRPLIPLTDDQSDLDCLTPALFLIQRSSLLIPQPRITGEKIPISRRWDLVTQMMQLFWDRWSAEYLISLQARQKWLHPQRSVQVGDVVLIKNELTAPSKWPLARVIEIHPGKDDHVRAVTLKTASSKMQRPITKLVLLLTDKKNK